MLFFILIFFLISIYLVIHIYYSFCPPKIKRYLKVLVFCFIGSIVFSPVIAQSARFFKRIEVSEFIQFFLYSFSAFLLTLFLIYLLSDILKFIKFYPKFLKEHEIKEGIFFLIISGIITIIGYLNAMTPIIMRYDIEVDKPNKFLTIGVISDLHIGSFNMTPAKLSKAVEKINKENPDLIFLVGDIFDSHSSGKIFTLHSYGEILSRLKSKYGVYAVMGNHEYYTNSTEADVSLVKEAGINLLRDDKVYIKPLGVYLIGREDRTKSFKGLGKVLSLSELMPAKNPEDIIVVLSHNPLGISEAVSEQVDLQISGHTHNGQLFPINFFLKALYEVTWGIKRIKNTVLFVSSGLGQWGPPVKTSAVSEIAILKVYSTEKYEQK